MKLAKKLLILFFSILLSAVLIVVIGYNLYQGKIQPKIEALVNETIKGEVKINNLSFTLFSTYPKMAISIHKISLFENRTTDSIEVLSFENLRMQIDISKALDGVYLIDEFEIGEGVVHILRYADSSLNVLNAIKMVDADSAKEDANSIKLELSKLIFANIQVFYADYLTNQYMVSSLKNLLASIKMEGDSLAGNVQLAFVLDSMMVEQKRIIKRQELSLAVDFNANLLLNQVEVTNGIIKLNLLKANVAGFYDGTNKGFVDFKVWAKHTDLSDLAKMDIFKEENLPKIKHGKFEIDALIKGYTQDEMPQIEATASLSGLEVYNRFGKVIDNAGFNLFFNSPSSNSLRDARLVVDSIRVDFTSGGFFKGRVEVEDFVKPQFQVTWEAVEQLEDIDKLIKIPAVNKIEGQVISTGAVGGTYEIKTQKLFSYQGGLTVHLDNVNVVLAKNDYPITDINGSFYIINEDFGIKELSLNANSNTIIIKGKVENLLPLVMEKSTNLSASLAVKSALLKTETLLAFDKSLADSNKYIVHDLDVNIQVNLASNALSAYKIIPTGQLKVFNFTALVDGAPPIRNFSGEINSDSSLLAIKNFKGMIDKSQIDFSVSILNYAEIFQSEIEKQMVVDVSLKSEQINIKDFFTINHTFLLPKNYEEEVLKELAFTTKVITTNFELQKKELLPEFEFQIKGLQFKTLYSPIIFKDIIAFGMIENNNVYVNRMSGKFGRSDLFMNAVFDNAVATKDTISRPLVSKVAINSNVLDLNEIIKLSDGLETETETETETDTVSVLVANSSSNLFGEKFPITDFQLNIGELNYLDASIKNVSGLLKIKENNIIKLDHVKFQSGKFGSFEFDGELDASSQKDAILNSTIKISDVDLSKLKVTFTKMGEEVKISDHFEGQVSGVISVNMPISQNLKFDLAQLKGKVKVKIINGALINYAPLEELGSYFKNKDLNRVRFDTLKNTMILNNGKLLLPFMTINTTLGVINVMGFQSLNNDMEYDIQVPVKLVAGSTLNSLFSSKRGDDKKQDQIKKRGRGRKYVTVHISGKDDKFKFKLGKKRVLTAPPGFKVD